MPKPLYDVLLICHIAVAFIGFGSIAITGVFARRGVVSKAPGEDETVVRFFRPGTDWPGRLVLLVPFFGLAMLFGGDRVDVPAVWPWIGLAIWTVAVGLVSGTCWPAERQAQQQMLLVRQAGNGVEADAAVGAFREACRRLERGAGFVSVLFVMAVTVMVWQPHG